MPMHSERRMTLRWAKIGPPLRGRIRKPAGVVATLAQATTPLLSSGLPDAMTMPQTMQGRV